MVTKDKKKTDIKYDKSYIINKDMTITIDHNGIFNLIREKTNSHLKIIIENNVEAKIIEKYNFSSPNFDIQPYHTSYYLNENAKVITYNHVMQNKFDFYEEKTMYLSENAYLKIVMGMFGKNIDFTLNVNLTGKGAKTEISVMSYNDNMTQGKYNINTNHLAEHTDSIITNHGVLNSNSKCSFNVSSFIKKGSHQSSAYQHSKVICLDDNSQADLNPILLIDDYDVKAGHGATVSRISSDDLYYLQSRGLSKNDAYLLVALGFLLKDIDDAYENVSSYLKTRIENERE